MKPILAPGGKCRGYLKEVGNRKELIAKGGRLIAFYDRTKDQTVLSGGQLFGFGDQLMALLED